MKIESIAINKLSADPANANKHTDKSIAALVAILRRFGQQKPIVIDRSNVVRAGNGTLEAAKQLGWKKIDCVRSALEGSEMTGFAIADNKSAKNSDFDDEIAAAQIAALRDEGMSAEELGFVDDKELEKLLKELEETAAAGEGAGGGGSTDRWMIVVTCKGEADQAALLEEQAAAGRDCRALVG